MAYVDTLGVLRALVGALPPRPLLLVGRQIPVELGLDARAAIVALGEVAALAVGTLDPAAHRRHRGSGRRLGGRFGRGRLCCSGGGLCGGGNFRGGRRGFLDDCWRAGDAATGNGRYTAVATKERKQKRTMKVYFQTCRKNKKSIFIQLQK